LRFAFGLCLASELLLACGPAPREAPGTEAQAIIGGQADTTDLFVFLIDMTFDNGNTAVCSATLIGSKSLLTAAHCIDPKRQCATSVTIQAMNGASSQTTPPCDYVTVTSYALHPQWDPTAMTSPYDCAMLLLPGPPSNGAPEPWNTAALGNFTGETVRAVGYGRTAACTADTGIRHDVSVTVNSVAADSFAFGASGTAGICSGDSGGPSLYTFSDGVERQVGLHSYTTSAACGDGVDVRTDFVASFISGWLATNDPGSGPDAGAITVDAGTPPDAGSACTTNSDCPAPMQCVGGVCVAPLSAGSPCVPGTSACVSGTVCTAPPGAATLCRDQCPLAGVCQDGQACIRGVNNTPYCDPTSSTSPTTPVLGSVGCSTSGKEMPLSAVLAVVAWACVRRRQRWFVRRSGC
jgi:V8-like Glu-specific endopeptidase